MNVKTYSLNLRISGVKPEWMNFILEHITWLVVRVHGTVSGGFSEVNNEQSSHT